MDHRCFSHLIHCELSQYRCVVIQEVGHHLYSLITPGGIPYMTRRTIYIFPSSFLSVIIRTGLCNLPLDFSWCGSFLTCLALTILTRSTPILCDCIVLQRLSHASSYQHVSHDDVGRRPYVGLARCKHSRYLGYTVRKIRSTPRSRWAPLSPSKPQSLSSSRSSALGLALQQSRDDPHHQQYLCKTCSLKHLLPVAGPLSTSVPHQN